ncbi:MAG: ABC transporter ATP-binding protein [Chthonomonas sp.]|nr:ABC transporter ATP-binding protein [Chthonomonas sp.]
MSALALEAKNLHIQYRQKDGKVVEAVRDLSFSVSPGEVVGFLGPNGAGKSSTIKHLMGFQEAKFGEALVFGEKAGQPSANAKIGYLPEVALYYPFLTPLETLKLYGEVQGLRGAALQKEACELLEIVGLSHALKKQNRTLSKGMLQRVGIAQSLLGSPQLLILDEVTSGLDPVGRKELRNLLLERKRNGATLFFSSHELAEVEMLCDRLLLIHQGKLVEERDLPTLKNELRNYAIEFAGHTNLTDLADHIDKTGAQSQRATFGNKELLIQAVARINQAGGQIIDLVSQEGSLEDYFIQTIQEAA